MYFKVSAAFTGLLLGATSVALGQIVIPIPNGDFEGVTAAVTSPPGIGANTGSIGSWNGRAEVFAALSTSVASGIHPASPLPGNYDLEIVLPVGIGALAGISQTLPQTFQPNSVYELSVQLDQGTIIGLVGGSSLNLLAGGVPVATLPGTSLLSLVDGAAGFQTVNLTYTTGAIAPVGNIGISLYGGSIFALGGSIYADNFSLTVVPEPEEYALMAGLSLIGFGLIRRRLTRGS